MVLAHTATRARCTGPRGYRFDGRRSTRRTSSNGNSMAIVLNRSQRSGGPGRTRWAEKRTIKFFDKWADSIRFQGPMRRGRGEKGGPIQFDSGCVSRHGVVTAHKATAFRGHRFCCICGKGLAEHKRAGSTGCLARFHRFKIAPGARLLDATTP
jgi:hypothetical protein